MADSAPPFWSPATATGTGTLVVTGASGFLGSAYCAHARVAGRPLRALVRGPMRSPARARFPSSPEQVSIIALDLETASHSELVAALAGTRAVVHLAGRAHRIEGADHAANARRAKGVDRFMTANESADSAMQGPNVEATARLARAAVAASVERFVFASSIKIHGEATAPGRPFRPADPPVPQDAYARSKAAAEAALISAAAGTRMQPVILRLPLVYGAGAKGNFSRLVDAVAEGRWLPLASIHNRRSLLSLGNLLTAIDASLDATLDATLGAELGAEPGAESRAEAAATQVPRVHSQVHLLADADAVSTPQLVRAVAAALGVSPRLVPFPVSLLRLAGAATNRVAAIARLTDSLEADTTSFTAWTGWRPSPFAIDAAMVDQESASGRRRRA